MSFANAGGVSAAGNFCSIKPEWRGETAFVIAGGPSALTQNVQALRGRKVITINSGCYTEPWADFLFFMDARWWRKNRAGCDAFRGRMLTTGAVPDQRIGRLVKRPPDDGFATDPREVMCKRTSLAGVLGVLAHLRPDRAILLGADCRFSDDGKRNRYEPHASHRDGTWGEQRDELALTVEPLKALGIEVFNASPGSALPFWPIVRLEDCL